MNSLLKSLRQIGTLFRKAPFLILLLQLPEVSVDWLDRLFRDAFEAKPLLGAGILFPYFILASSLSTALTALAARELENGRPIKLGWLIAQVGKRIFLFLKTSFACGLFIVVGMPVLIPALYFMTVYLFVPVLTVFDSPAPALTMLARSKRLAKLDFLKVFCFTLFFLGVGVVFFLIQGEIDKWLIDQMNFPAISGAFADSIFALALGVTVNLGVYVLYGHLNQMRILKTNEIPGDSAPRQNS